MKNSALILVALIFASGLFGKVLPDENILANGMLQTDRTDTPPTCWNVSAGGQYMEFNLTGGPGDKPFVRFCNISPEPNKLEISLRQNEIKLVAGERYKLAAWIKTSDFQCKGAGVGVINKGWSKSLMMEIHPGTSDWTYMEIEDVMVDNPDANYSCVIYAANFAGEIDIADLQLYAISEEALENTIPTNEANTLRRFFLYPVEPLLCNIPNTNPVVTFKAQPPQKEMAEGMQLVVQLDDVDFSCTQPLVFGENKVTLPGDVHSGNLQISVVNPKSGDTITQETFPYAVVEMPTVTAGERKRLNNLVVELVNAPLKANADAQEFHFSLLRDGWVFIAAEKADSPDLRIVLDDDTQVLDAATPRLEVFRELHTGDHVLVVKGANAGGNLIVRSIPEIFNYCPCVNSLVNENPPYDWEYHKKNSLPAVTTQNGGAPPTDPGEMERFHELGYKWLANLNTSFEPSGASLVAKLENCSGMNDPRYDGVTCDEQFFDQPSYIVFYTDGIKAYQNRNNRLIYTWICGKPYRSGWAEDFIAACVNASHGRGKLLREAYCRTKATKEEAEEYLNDNILDTVVQFKRCYPNILANMGIILGNFNQLPILSLRHHPSVDYKYYLDMQLNLLANNPECQDLGCVGYWGSYYADDELHRWSYMLLRHYCVEGKTTMLSDEYGFEYIPGLVQNGDFEDGFEGWNCEGNVSLDHFDGFANASQNRWGGNNGVGDTFAVLSKKNDEVSTLTQTAYGLVPGKPYLLEFSTFDADDVKAKRVAGRDFGIRATLDESAEIQGNLSWQHIDMRETGRYAQNNGCARPNLHHIVFIAKESMTTITLDNKLAKPGENLGVNCFSVTPYLAE